MKTYNEDSTEGCAGTAYAIIRSITHDEIVTVICDCTMSGLTTWIVENYDAVDYAFENNGDTDVWGEYNGESFRLRLRKES